MKKLISVLLIAMLLFGCAAPKEEPKNTPQAGGDTQKEQQDAQKNEEKPAEKVKVLLMISALGDLSFNDSAAQGIEMMKEKLGDKVEAKLIEYGNDKSKEEPAFLEAAEGDSDVIIFSSNMKSYLEQYAPEYPEKKFIIFDTAMDYEGGKNSNVYSIVYKANEASFLGGYLAAKLSDTGVIGFLGGNDLPIISDFLVGFIQGAKEANPDVKVTTTYVGAWNDSAKGKEQSLAMVNQKASVIFGVAGGSGAGAIEVGKEKGIKILGVDSDQALIYESQGKADLAQNIVTSVLKNVGDSLFRAVDLHVKGELQYGSAETLGLSENGVGLADNKYYQQIVSEEIRAEIEGLKEKVAKGEIKVDSAYGMTTDQISEIRNSVKP